MPVANLVALNSVLAGLTQNRKMARAVHIFDEMAKKNLGSRTLIRLYMFVACVAMNTSYLNR